MKLYLNSNIIKGTPEELVTYQELLKERGLDSEKSLFSFGHEHQPTEEEVQDTFKGFFGSLKLDKSSIGSAEISTDEEESPSTDLKVGDRVKVLESENGAVGEATVTAVLADGKVRLEGKSDSGVYSYQWSNNTSNLEKIEEEQSKHKQEIHDYYEVVDPDIFASSVEKGTVLKVIGDTYALKNKEGNDRDYIDLVTSTGLSQTSPMRDSVIKPIIDNSFIADRFKFAKEAGVVLAVDTDFAEECKGHYFKVTKDEYLSNFTPKDILTVRRDDGSNAIAFQDFNNSSQFTLLIDVKEIARPSK